MAVSPRRPRRRRPLIAGPFAPAISLFGLHRAAEGKALKTVRTYTEAVSWFAAARLISRTSHAGWEHVSGHDVQRWMVHLLAPRVPHAVTQAAAMTGYTPLHSH